MTQYAVLIYAHDSAHAPDATREDTESSDRHSDELAQSGSMVMACALTPRDLATSIRGDTITDGPFVDSKEVIAGFYVIEAPDLDVALAIARLNPVVREGGGVEVRPVHSSRFVKREEQTTGVRRRPGGLGRGRHPRQPRRLAHYHVKAARDRRDTTREGAAFQAAMAGRARRRSR
jgi:hypothetical protein